MPQRTAALLLLLLGVLLLLLVTARAHRTHDTRQTIREARPRRHDSEEHASGRRWTTSRNSPYQKIVSSYEQEVPEGEVDEPESADQAKAKSHKRKQWRTSDQIPSETSSIGESDKAGQEHPPEEREDHGRDPSEQSDQPVSEATKKPVARRRTTTSHPVDEGLDFHHVELSTSSPKKRRRLPTTSTTTTTSSPQTMSDSLYHHFQPLDQNVPQDDIIPFLDFGRKLSPVIPTPSGVNSIESKATVTRLRTRHHHEEKESNSSDEDMLQEDMDVTVVRKAIERNSVPRAKLRVREQGISDYYRKRVPTQVRTTENLISSSDTSTASSILGSKNVIMLKKGNRHQIHHEQLVNAHEQNPINSHVHKDADVEILEEKITEISSRPNERTAALREETHHSPLTAESSLVKTIIKEVPTTERNVETDHRNKNTTVTPNITTALTTTVRTESTITTTRLNRINGTQETTSKPQSKPPNNSEEEASPKILSTAVVTSVSIEGSLQDTKAKTVLESPLKTENKTKVESGPLFSNTTKHMIDLSRQDTTTYSELSTKSFISHRNLSNSLQTKQPSSTDSNTANTTSNEPKTIPVRNDSSLRSRDIYRPKAIPSSLNIHHLPRQIPFNITRKPSTNTSSTSTSMIILSTTTTLPTTVKPTVTTSSVTITSSESTPLTTSAKSVITVKAASLPPKVEPPQEARNSKASTKETTSNRNSDENIPIDETTNSNNRALEEDSHTDNLNLESDKPSVSNNGPPFQSVETESIPPPKYEEPGENLTFVPVSPEEEFPIYFTTVPVVDTRPKTRMRPATEATVVRQHRNLTGADWVKVGAVDKEVEVVYPEALGVGAYLLAGLGVVPLLLGALIGARFILAHNRKKVLDESEYSSEYNRSPLGTSTASPLPTKLPRIPTHVGWSETEKSLPAIPPVTSPVSVPGAVRWEFPREKLRLQTLLGQGNFGQVWKAEADDIAGHEGLTRLVAVKTVKESANAREREDLLRELGIMQELGSHPNVVTLLGCCTEKEPIYLIMEYVMYGKLLSFLRDRRTRSHYYNFSDATDALTSRDLTVFAYCVARGMDYLTNKSIIHRDIAARNVLVDHNKLCKIADFGMSRNVRDTGQIYEQRQSKGALPIRWMAPESLHFSLFTHKTDVWSFGILMWEIVTLGSTPYARMGAREVMRRVGDGYRLERPSHCRPELFRLISQCWHSEPSKRPTFAELKAELATLLCDKEHNGSLVDLESYADEMRRDSLHRHH